MHDYEVCTIWQRQLAEATWPGQAASRQPVMCAWLTAWEEEGCCLASAKWLHGSAWSKPIMPCVDFAPMFAYLPLLRQLMVLSNDQLKVGLCYGWDSCLRLSYPEPALIAQQYPMKPVQLLMGST